MTEKPTYLVHREDGTVEQWDDETAQVGLYLDLLNSEGVTRVEDKTCYTCNGSGQASRGWCGLVSSDGRTCPDCKGVGVDQTPMGTGMDCCPYNGTDWRQPCGHNGVMA